MSVKHILLIDDDEDEHFIMQKMLVMLRPQAEFKTLFSGMAGLTWLQNPHNNKPGLVILDINMPGLNGLECLEKMRQVPGLNNIPVVMHTTSNSEAEVQAAKRLGANFFLTKQDFYPALESFACLLDLVENNNPYPTDNIKVLNEITGHPVKANAVYAYQGVG